MLVYQRVLEMAMIPDMKGHQRFEWVWYLKKGYPSTSFECVMIMFSMHMSIWGVKYRSIFRPTK